MTEYRYIGKDGKPILARDLEDQRDELQDKLTKALAALKYTDDSANHGTMTTTYSETTLRYILRNIRDRARVVLDEIKGET
jgi:polysaccharide deacetylase 2 family uncharacterized protein YibQ